MSAALVRSLGGAIDTTRDVLAALVDAQHRAQRDPDSPTARQFMARCLSEARANTRALTGQLDAIHIVPAGCELPLNDTRKRAPTAQEGGR